MSFEKQKIDLTIRIPLNLKMRMDSVRKENEGTSQFIMKAMRRYLIERERKAPKYIEGELCD